MWKITLIREKEIIGAPLGIKIVFGILSRVLTAAAGYLFIQRSMKAIAEGYMTGFSATSPFAYLAAVAAAALFIWPEMLFRSRKAMVCRIFYFYTVILFACVFHPSVTYYYYYSRYIVQYMFIILVMLGVVIENIRWSYIKYGIYIACTGIAIYLFTPYNKVLMENEDDTRISYEALDSLMKQFKKGDAVIVQPELMNQVFYALETATEAKVYTVLNGYIKHTVEVAGKTSDNVYFTSGDLKVPPGMEYKESMGLKLYSDSLEKYIQESDSKGTETRLDTERVTSIDSYVSYIVKAKESRLTSMPYPLEHGRDDYKIRIDRCIIEY